jgi:hypothetical protein
MTTFLQWLSDLKFDGSDPETSGVSKGLAYALMVRMSLCYSNALIEGKCNNQLSILFVIRCSKRIPVKSKSKGIAFLWLAVIRLILWICR